MLTHCAKVKLKLGNIDFVNDTIRYEINNQLFEEQKFDFFHPELEENDLEYLNIITKTINKNNKEDINFLREEIYQLESKKINWLKLVAFFVNEAYLNKEIVYDKHQRVTSQEINTAYITYLEYPVVDILAKLFCKNANLEIEKKFQLNFTCDFDILNNWEYIGFIGFAKRMFRNMLNLQFITLFKELISWRLADKSTNWNFYLNDRMFFYPLQGKFRSFETRNIAFMLVQKDNSQYDVDNNFTTTAFNNFYTKLQTNNVETGIHPNYDTTKSRDTLINQIKKFKEIFGFHPKLSRFHYLKCNFPNDLSLLEDNNISEDYSYDFANSLLFRGGRSFSLKLWNSKINRPQEVVSVPLSIMDTTLNDYLYLNYTEALKLCKLKILLSMAFGSTLTLLWHNHNMYKNHRPYNYHPKLFKKLVAFMVSIDRQLSINKSTQVCFKCILDSSDDPDIQFDKHGVCNHCRIYDEVVKKEVYSGKKGEEKLKQLVERIKKDGNNKKYDCLVGISGGVDSTYVAYLCKKIGLRPLAVHLDNGWNSELAVKNIENILNKLDIELETYVIDWEEFKDLQLSYLKASVVDIEAITDHAIFASLYKTAAKYGIKYIINGLNVVTEGYLPAHWIHNKFDLMNINGIHNKFGNVPLKTFPKISLLEKIYYERILAIKFIPILNYVDFIKEDAKKIISEELDWRDYGGKHFESIFTRFYQAYILPRKFNIDKRKSHYSTLVCSGQLTREEAFKEMEKEIYDPVKLNADKEFVIKKFGLTAAEFDDIMNLPIKKHTDYPSYMNLYVSARPFIKSTKRTINKLKSIYK